MKILRTILIAIVVFITSFSLGSLWVNKNEINLKDRPIPKAQITNIQQNLFIEKIAPASQQEEKKYGVFASLIMAQAILESGWGLSSLAADYNNFFGIKTDTDNKDYYVLMPTKEFYDGKWVTINAKFARYSDPIESIEDHTQLFLHGTTWNEKQYIDVLNSSSYQQAARGLVKDGYATDPAYAEKIIKLIQKYNLDIFDVQYGEMGTYMFGNNNSYRISPAQ